MVDSHEMEQLKQRLSQAEQKIRELVWQVAAIQSALQLRTTEGHQK